MATNFLQNALFQDIILPFVLIFTLIFAILQKSKIFGEGKQQADAIIAFAIAAILVAFSQQVDWIKKFSVFLAVALVIYFVFMLIWGFAYGAKDGDMFGDVKWMKGLLGGIAFVAVIVAVLLITDTWDKVYTFFTTNNMGANIVFLVLIVAAIVWVTGAGKSKGDKGKD